MIRRNLIDFAVSTMFVGAIGVAVLAFALLLASVAQAATYNVTSYGAVGNGIHDDTAGIRGAITAATNAGGGTVYFPTGTYAVCPQNGDNLTIYNGLFTITGSNLIFQGDGPAASQLVYKSAGLTNPATHWSTAAGTKYRSFMFRVDSSGGALHDLTWTGLRMDGGCAFTGDFTLSGDPNGWDASHKAISLGADGVGSTDTSVDRVTVTQCLFINWRGEEVYSGGVTLKSITISDTSFLGTNGSALSVGARCTVDNCWFGGPNAGDDCYNAIENYLAPGGKLRVTNSHFRNCSGAKRPVGECIIVSLFGGTGPVDVWIEHNTFDNTLAALYGDLQNVTFTRNDLTNITVGVWPNNAATWANQSITITWNKVLGGSELFLPRSATPENGLTISHNRLRSAPLMSGGLFGGSVVLEQIDNITY